MKKALKYIFFISYLIVKGQVFDDFSDSNLSTSPTWQGDITNFVVANGQLQSAGQNTNNQKIQITTSNQLIDSTEWSFLIDLKFNPTSSNLARIYLVANQPDLKASLNGYFIQFGETNADSMDFFKQTGSVSTKLFTSKTSFSGNIKARIKVTRSSKGEWLFYIDVNDRGIYQLEGSVTDLTHVQNNFVGIYCEYSTASRYNLFNFDDFKISLIEKDTIKPKIISNTIVNNNQISLKFSENVNKASALNLSNYSISPSIGRPAQINYGLDSSILLLNFNSSFESGNTYQLTVSGISDNFENILNPTLIEFPYYIPKENSLLINEIMADPTPSFGLPEFEYIELYNNSKFTINLEGWKISKGSTDIIIPNYNLMADSFLILTSTSAANQFSKYGAFIGVASFPGLTNIADKLIIKNENGIIINQVTYSDDWYQDIDKSDGGFSLELINPTQLCRGSLNWRASNNINGGTPGKKNSVFSILGDTINPEPTEVLVSNSSTLIVNFNEVLDSVEAKKATNYVFNPIIEIQNIKKINDKSYVINTSPLENGITYSISINGQKDCLGNVQTKSKTFTLGIGQPPSQGDILITEIFADENPVIKLPEAEYIELYNTTSKILDLSGVTFTDGTSSIASFPPNSVLFPKEYVIICGSTKVNLFKSYGRVFGLSSFPSLNSSGDNLELKSKNDELIHKVAYLDDWYRDGIKDDGGYSLEMINPSLVCKGGLNWTSSISSTGGTPGSQNSVLNLDVDQTSPKVNSTTFDKDTLFIVFDEPMDQLSLKLLDNYQFDGGITSKSVFIPMGTENNLVGVIIDSFTIGKIYNLSISNVKDCSGNLIMPNTTISFGLGKSPKKYEILFTEIFADENPIIGLPEAEYIEIYNNSENIIDLKGCKIGDASNSIAKFSSTSLLHPQEYAVICSSTKVELFMAFGKVFALPNFPSLNSSNDYIYIKNPSNEIVHFVDYSDTWYGNETKKDGGWSLEMVDKTNVCGAENNWSASIDPTGGTPAKKNSIEANNPDQTKPKIDKTIALDSLNLEITFTENLDSLSLINATYSITPQVEIVSKTCFGPTFKTIRLLLKEQLQKNVIYTLSTSNQLDCVGNFSDNQHTTFVLPERETKGDIIINEILFNPRVGGNDFIEIYNQSNKYINLKNWNLSKLKSNGTLETIKKISSENLLIKPKTYKILTDNRINIKQNYPRSIDSAFIEMPSLPTFTDESDSVILLNEQLQPIDSFYYDEDYHFPLLDNVEGVSLERISFLLPSNDKNSWQSASSTAGYATPGYLNSQAVPIGTLRENIEIKPKVITPNGDGNKDFATIQYKFEKSGFVATIIIYDSKGREVKAIAKNELMGKEGVYNWDGTTADNEKAPVGYYVVIIEIFGLTGEQHKWTEPIAVFND